MTKNDYLEDISAIKSIMNKSTRFISLSGLSGILAGLYALAGAAFGYWLVHNNKTTHVLSEDQIFNYILFDLIAVAIFAMTTGIYLTYTKAKKNGEKMFDQTGRRAVTHFLIPLLSGGAFILITLKQLEYGQIAALMLLFYGLALINASKFTLSDIKYLGGIEIGLGLLCALIPSIGFWLWVIGFGVMHIIYGIIMHVKYEKNDHE